MVPGVLPEDNRRIIEFIGDSISTGFGALGTTSDSDGGSPKWQDATVAYPFLTAKALGAADKIGSIETGKYADFIITDAAYETKRVFIGGKEI